MNNWSSVLTYAAKAEAIPEFAANPQVKCSVLCTLSAWYRLPGALSLPHKASLNTYLHQHTPSLVPPSSRSLSLLRKAYPLPLPFAYTEGRPDASPVRAGPPPRQALPTSGSDPHRLCSRAALRLGNSMSHNLRFTCLVDGPCGEGEVGSEADLL